MKFLSMIIKKEFFTWVKLDTNVSEVLSKTKNRWKYMWVSL